MPAVRRRFCNSILAVLSYVKDLADSEVPGLPSGERDFSVPLGRTPSMAHGAPSITYTAGSNAFCGQPNFEYLAGNPLEIPAQ